MAYCGKCLHLDVCKTADSCDGHVPRCKHFMDKGGQVLTKCQRLIDLDKTLQRLEEEVWWTESQKSSIRLFLYKSKVKDAVEVVRCKNCKNNGECSIQDAMNWTPRTEIRDSFCSYGERREGE